MTHDNPPTAPDQPFTVLNADAQRPLLLVCEHASNQLPPRYQNLGLAPSVLAHNHIAWDIGAGALTRRLAERLRATAVLAGYSRLLIDCNRQPGAPTSIPAVSDGIPIPGNQDVNDAEAAWRLEHYFWPFHHAVTQQLARLWRHGPAPALVAVHSFTPTLENQTRPWQVGVLWNHDPRMAQPLLHWLRTHGAELCVGDNQPYSGRSVGFTVQHHAGAAGLPHVAWEVRQDLLAGADACAHWAELLGAALEDCLADPSIHRVEHY